MPFEIEDHPKYLLLRLLPVWTARDIQDAVTELIRIEATHPVMKNRILDFTAVDAVDAGFPDIEAAAKRRRGLKLTTPIRSAMIAVRPIQVGYARMFQTLNDNPKIEMRIVETMDEALLWILSD